jgi:CBS domain-containing protein
MQVRTMMHTEVVTAAPTMSLAQGQRLMREHHIRHVPVVEGTQLVGMFTDRDLREATPSPATTLTHGEIAYRLDTTAIATCMTQGVVWLRPDDDMVHAARLLLVHKFGCLPVLEDGALVGVVTEIDCLRAFLATVL